MAKTNPLQTPAMRQYLSFKEQVGDAILFFRMGDFYEMFFEDAVVASEILGITLTSRHKDEGIPLAGVPWHSADNYIKKLLDAGKNVAVCEQVEKPDPKKKAVKRKLTRILTPGTVIEESSLPETDSNWLFSYAVDGNFAATVWTDVSCGDLFFTTMESADLDDFIKRVRPKETICFPVDKTVNCGIDVQSFELWVPSGESAEYLQRYDAVISEHPLLQKAFTILLFYLDSLYFGNLPPLRSPRRYAHGDSMALDSNTIANLELYQTVIGGHRTGSLLSVVDFTKTPMGARLLRRLLSQPLYDKERIERRLNAVDFLVRHQQLSEWRDALKNVRDIERILSRIKVKRGTPREISALASSLTAAMELLYDVEQAGGLAFLPFVAIPDRLRNELPFKRWRSAFVDEIPAQYRDGGFIAPSFDSEVNRLSQLISNSRSILVEVEQKERAATGLTQLKVGFNRVFGYYIEIPKRFHDRVPDHYVRKQTTANAERYFTPELKEIESEILSARERLTETELRLLEQLVTEIEGYEEEILALAHAIAWFDFFLSFATAAAEYNWIRPEFSPDRSLSIVNGRHPVVEALLKVGDYVPTSVKMGTSDSRMLIVTGPNMGGKSTVMRMVALIALLAQSGSFVPADSAELPLFDAVFTRVGASDNLSKGESTFLVEMKESASILDNATEHSLIILDEIGRGTGTYDGISIAWAIIEHIILNIRANTLFATHYHVLTELENEYPSIKNMHMFVRKFSGRLQFTYQLKEGGSNRSFGIEVARLARMPSAVVERASEILRRFEQSDLMTQAHYSRSPQTSIFSLMEEPVHADSHEVLDRLRDLNVDDITPKEALELLYDVKDKLNEKEKL